MSSRIHHKYNFKFILNVEAQKTAMGIVKSLMIEMEEAQWEETEATFYCPNCSGETEGLVELPVVFHVDDSKELPITVTCGECGQDFFGWVQTDWHTCAIELDDFPEIDVQASPVRSAVDDYDYDHDYIEWLEQQEHKSRPVYAAFYRTISDIKTWITQVSLEPRSQMLARMLLVQSITALETYLSDTFVWKVLEDKEVQSRLLRSKILEIGTIQFKLADAIGVENFAKEKLIEQLRAVSFHNLKKVSKLFQIGLGINALPENDDLVKLEQAIKMRHDCVHRNGRDRETDTLHQIDKALLSRLIQSISSIVGAIETEIEQARSL